MARLKDCTRTFVLVDWLIIPNVYYVEHVDSAQKRTKTSFQTISSNYLCPGMDILLLSCWYVGIEADVFLQLWYVLEKLLLERGHFHLFIGIKAFFSLHVTPSAVQYQKIYN